MNNQEQFQNTLCERLFWHTAEHNDAKVADYLFHHKEMNMVYAMDEATLFDSFFKYMQEIGVFPFLDDLDPGNQQRENVSFNQIVLILLMKVVGSIKTMEEVSDLLLTDELLMNMCGFNAYQVKNGSCKRGEKLRKSPPPEIRGSLCVDTVAKHVSTITPYRIEKFFNRCIQQLAQQKGFPEKIHASCDTTLYETTNKYDGCGSVTRKRKVKARGHRKCGELKEIPVTLYGWKVWAVYDTETQIPLAIKIDTIEKPDNRHLMAVLKQAMENVKPAAIIDTLVIDRGFLDGKDLYKIDQLGIGFVVPLKRNMEAAQDARQLALNYDDFTPATRETKVIHGYGKNKYTETLTTTLAGVPDLLSCDWFNPEGSKANTTKKDYEPIPLNTVVVKEWDNKTPSLEKQVVLVTNLEVKNPFITFDLYDDRSIMENNLFREVKQNWHFEHPPKKNKEGVFVHVYTIMAMKALTSSFLQWQEEQLKQEALGKETTWLMYRRKLKMLNRNKLIVFVGAYFGIFPSHEVFMLADVPVHNIAKELNINRKQILAKYTEIVLTKDL